jgi:hypothetical protein
MEFIFEAQRNFTSDARVQHHAVLALAALVNNHADNKMHATTLSVFQHLRSVLGNHPRDAGVNEGVARFLLYFMVDRLLVRGYLPDKASINSLS